MARAAESPASSRVDWRWHALAALTFGLVLVVRFRGLLALDLTEMASFGAIDHAPWGQMALGDLRFVIWLVSRNARTLLHDPARLFDAETCHPSERALALGEPGIALGVLGVPFQAAFGDPVLTFNCVLLALLLISAFAAYLLVCEWTGEPAAGIFAGLLYGLHPARMGNPVHPYLWDTGWTVLAMFFATRLLSRGRWRDAAGLALAVTLQLGGSLYAILGGFAVALPCSIALLAQHGWRRLRLGPCLLVAALVVLAAAAFYTPYLMLRGEESALARSGQVVMLWSHFLPGRPRFSGWLLVVFAILGLVLSQRRGPRGIRWALLAGWLLVLWLASGPDPTFPVALRGPSVPVSLWPPDLYGALSRLLPGLDLVRVPAEISAAANLALGLLAGLGAAALLLRTPRRWRRGVVLGLVLLAAADVLRAASLGGGEIRYRRVRPHAERLAVFQELEDLGNDGPIFERTGRVAALDSHGVLASAYHHRRTSACWSSFDPKRRELRRIGDELPSAEAVRELSGMGFTTVVFHHLDPRSVEELRRLEQELSEQPEPSLRRLAGIATFTVFEIVAPEDEEAPRS